jgi:outer membrane protein TolC
MKRFLPLLIAIPALAQRTGSVATVQSSIPGATTSVNTLNSSVQIQGTYTGSTSSVKDSPFSGKLSLKEAIDRALGHNLGTVGLSIAVRQARGQERVSRSALLPNLNAGIRDNYFTTNLQALGIKVPFLPTLVGPVNYFDVRATLTQTLFDLGAVNNHRASQEVVQASEQAVKDARDIVVLATAGAYLQVIASAARVQSAKAQLETAKAVYSQTLQRRQAGIAAQIEVNRSLVQQQTQQQRIATLENDLARQKINLARLTGLPVNDDYQITDQITFAAPPALAVDDAVKQALETRADLKSAAFQVRAAERTRTAARADRLPTFGVSADLGEIGTRPNQSEHTYTVVASIKIPIWQGGRAAGEHAQADANLDQRRAEAEDLRGKIESDIRNAYLDLKAATSQLELSRNNQELAKETLRLSKEKFDAGVTDSLEVTQAVEAVASSDLDAITALFAHNLAKLSLARALGDTETKLQAYLTTR